VDTKGYLWKVTEFGNGVRRSLILKRHCRWSTYSWWEALLLSDFLLHFEILSCSPVQDCDDQALEYKFVMLKKDQLPDCQGLSEWHFSIYEVSILYDQCGVLKPLRRVFRHQASDKYFSRSYLHFRHSNYKTSSSLTSTGRDGHESKNLLQISNLIVLKNERSLKEKDVKSFKRISHQLELIHLHILLQAIFLPHPKLSRLFWITNTIHA